MPIWLWCVKNQRLIYVFFNFFFDVDGQVAGQAAQAAARHARRGSFYAAQMETRAAQRMLVRNNIDEEKIQNWSSKVDALDQVVAVKRKVSSFERKKNDRFHVFWC